MAKATEPLPPEGIVADAEPSAEPAASPEVRPEEFTQGSQAPVWRPPLPAEVVEALRAPLDPNRIRSRAGRGSGKFEYLAGHDVKRRANELFGFGNWGSRIVSLEETARVQVTNATSGNDGWHISYSCIVEVTVRGCLPFSDVGYGDGVEYGPAALATARELATKEASTDALKRAFTGWGDQFGLILYAKDDEKKRIARDENRNDSAAAAVRQDNQGDVPKTWAQIFDRMKNLTGDDEIAGWWLGEAISAKYGSLRADLSVDQNRAAAQKCSGLVLDLEAQAGPEGLVFTPGVRKLIQAAIAARFDGIKTDGPPWALGPDEAETYPARGTDKIEAPTTPEGDLE